MSQCLLTDPMLGTLDWAIFIEATFFEYAKKLIFSSVKHIGKLYAYCSGQMSSLNYCIL